jgi:hypothetical protein
VHRYTRIRPRAVVWGLAVAACLCVAVPGAGIAADKPNPQPLWNAYPLDGDQGSSSGGASQNAATTTTAPQPAAPSASANTQPVTVTDTAGDGPPWALMIVAAAGGALLVVVLLMLQGRRSRRHEEALVGAADEWPWLGASPGNGTGEVRAARLRVATNGAAADVGSAQNRGAERAVEPASNGTASEWVADRDRGVDSEREMGVAPAEGAAAERVAEPQPVAEREPAANGAAAGWEPVADAAAGRSAEPPVRDEADDELVAEGEPEPAAEREQAAESWANEPAERAAEPETVGEPEFEPVAEEPMGEPAVEQVAEPEPEPVAEEPMGEPAVEHVAEPEPVAEAEPEPVAEAEPEPVAEPEAESVAEPEPEPVAEATMNGTAADRAEPVLDMPANGAAEHGAEPLVEASANGATGELAANGAAPAEDAHDSREHGFDVVEAAAVPRQRFDRAPANGRPAAARRGPICQVMWSAGAKCLFAVATDANGVEHRVAWSPPIAWSKAGPPDEDSREARAALRVLAKDLRDKGWRPMRAKGDDFDETRWYARRFRFPIVEGDDDPAPWRYGPPAAAARTDH